MAIRVSWGRMEPPFSRGMGGRRGSAIAPLERAMVVSYRLPIVTVALCVFCRNLQSNVSNAQINRGVGDFKPKFRGVPLALIVSFTARFNPLTPTAAIRIQLQSIYLVPVPDRVKPSFVIFEIQAV